MAYSFEAANKGNVDFTNVKVSDALPGLGVLNCSPTQLAAVLAIDAVINCEIALYHQCAGCKRWFGQQHGKCHVHRDWRSGQQPGCAPNVIIGSFFFPGLMIPCPGRTPEIGLFPLAGGWPSKHLLKMAAPSSSQPGDVG